MRKNQLRLSILLVIVSLIISGCGFHLRGNIPLPDSIKKMYVDAANGSFKEQLVPILESGGAQVMSSEASADSVLRIVETSVDRTIGTLDSRGKANSYDIVFTLGYRFDDTQGNMLREASLQEQRRYNFNPEEVIESESEEQHLIQEMEEAIALRIVRQLSTVTDLESKQN